MPVAAPGSRPTPTLVWFRQDLRLQDNPALAAARRRGGAVIPVFIWDEAGEGRWPPGAASRWWLHHSLASLDAALRARGSRLVLARGASESALRALVTATGATAVFWNRRYEPAAIARDKAIKAGFAAAGVDARRFSASLLFEPHTIANKAGGSFQVFTPFWRHCLSLDVEAPARLPPGALPSPRKWPATVELADFGLLPRIPWDAGLSSAWQPGEASATKRLRQFAAGAMEHYADQRNQPGLDGTSVLSPHLHWGEIGPRQIWAAVRARAKGTGVFPPHRGGQVFLSEVGWREFAHHLLFHFPATPGEPLRREFAAFPWADDRVGLRAWQLGRTGYPIVDAGMRQLWQTGWMHNRVRMIASSFLVKHLRISWPAGAAWFWDTLVDADLANNTLGWQWTAGCGADAAPYFRIFNPTIQGEKFDAAGDYVRRWVPELAKLPEKFIHQPWTAPVEVLRASSVELGRDYPQPMVDHGEARTAALGAYRAISRKIRP